MGFLSICVRLCMLHFLVLLHKGLGNATEPLSSSFSSASFSSSSPSSSHSNVIQDTTTTMGCSSYALVPQEVLQNLLEMTDAMIKDLQSQKQEESADHIGDEDPHLPSMEGLPQESESYNQRLLLALWESEAKNLQLKKEINRQKEETNKYKEELERKMEEKDQVMRDCHPNPHHRHTRHHHHHRHHPQPPPIFGAHPLSMTIDSTAILRSDLQDIKEVLLDMRDNGRSDRQDIKELIIDGIMETRYNEKEDSKKEPETQKENLWLHRKDCHDHFENGGKRESGVYTIYPFKGATEAQGVRVWCDMGEEDVGEGKGGGWTVILQRKLLPHPVLFNRTWEEYRDGFGSPDTEYWIGNEVLHQLTTLAKPQALRIDMEDFDGVYKFASYGRFSVGSEDDNFRLNVSMFSSRSTVKRDSLGTHNSAQFSTFDRDNDSDSGNCVRQYGDGGFWMNRCYLANPTAPIRGKGKNTREMNFKGFNNDYTTLKELTMRIRPSG